MNGNYLPPRNITGRPTYHRRNRKGNRTQGVAPVYVPLTTTTTTVILAATNSTAVSNASAVPIDDLFAPLSYLIQYKYLFLIGLILLIFLCLISIIFLCVLKCTRGRSWKTWWRERQQLKLAQEIPDFLDDRHDGKEENVSLLETSKRLHSATHASAETNGVLLNDNVSTTFSLDPMLEQKIAQNNPPSAMSLSPTADDTSLDTLRGSLISSPSQQIPPIASIPTPTRTTTTDSVHTPEERVVEAEKDDGLQDLDLQRLPQRYIKSVNNSTSNLPAHRTSGTSLEQSIRRQQRQAEEEERNRMHGSNSNLYEKTMRQQAAQGSIAKKPLTNSQVSLASRTSEDSCY